MIVDSLHQPADARPFWQLINQFPLPRGFLRCATVAVTMSSTDEKKTPSRPGSRRHSDVKAGQVVEPLSAAAHDDQLNLGVLGYKPELVRNRSMFTLLFQSLFSTRSALTLVLRMIRNPKKQEAHRQYLPMCATGACHRCVRRF